MSREASSANALETNSDEKVLKNRPKASALRQQKLPAWQPILTASTVIPTVIFVGVVFIPIGIALFLASDSVKEFRLDYTDCSNLCQFQINLTESFNGDVFFYYYLENFYQNHRRYVKSRNDRQYLGNLKETTDCDPFDKSGETPIAPCGAVANSIFNDTFRLWYGIPLQNIEVPVTTEGVLWSVDKDRKFKNPPIPAGGNLCDAFKDTVKPPNWSKKPCEIGGFENVDFIVWMRTAALPNFRKLWRLLNRSATPALGGQSWANGLPAGTYTLEVENNYPVRSFNGRKEFIISTTSWAGGKNSFLGLTYIIVGSVAIILAVVFIIIHVKFGHTMNEMANVSQH